ncbi:MAG: hypothetical protein FJ297_15835 [Planctomycetes bacterium]|nr:hypothetical protein [Planctomycetota bacterium]
MTGTELTSGEQAAPRVAVLGGGITGLAAALRFRETAPSLRCDLYEAEGRLGGVLGSEHADGYLVERGADMISTIEPWAVSLFRRIGFDSELIDTQDGNRRAFVAMGRRLFPVPEGFTLLQPRKLIPVLRSSLLTWRGKLRLLGEVFVRAR